MMNQQTSPTTDPELVKTYKFMAEFACAITHGGQNFEDALETAIRHASGTSLEDLTDTQRDERVTVEDLHNELADLLPDPQANRLLPAVDQAEQYYNVLLQLAKESAPKEIADILAEYDS